MAAALAIAAAMLIPAFAFAGPAPIETEITPGPSVPPQLIGLVGDVPSAATTPMLSASSSARARHGLGLPSWKELLGKGAVGKAAAADAGFAAKLDASAAPAPRPARATEGMTDKFDRLFTSRDVVRGRGGKQSRKLKVAATLSGGCPQLNELGTGYGWKGTGRATYEVTTTERVRRYDVVTAVVIDGSFQSRPSMNDDATAADWSGADFGEISITRNQVAIDRKTGKRHRIGETERYNSTLDPFYNPEGSFAAFVASQDDDRPAPPRPLRSGAWDDVAANFMVIPYDAMRSRVVEAEKLAQTPNACVTVSFDTRPLLAPSERIELTGVPKLTHDDINPFFILQFTGRIRAEWINFQGQSAEALDVMHRLWDGSPWYSFTAPAQPWPASAPVGLEFEYRSAAGVARTPVKFGPLDQTLHYKILDVTGTVDATDVKTVSGQCTFTGSPLNIDVGLDGSAPGGGDLDGDFGSIWTPITHTSQAYSTVHVCGENDPTECNFGVTSLPNQQLGINLQRVGDHMNVRWSFIAVQLGHSGCGLQVPDLYVDQELLKTTIPLSKFQGTEPFTVENTAAQQYEVQQGISTMSGQLDWSFEMTLQRVDEDGNPL
jgi:hypothetical protein